MGLWNIKYLTNFIILKKCLENVSVCVLFSLIQKATKENFLDNYWECPKWRHKLKRKGREKEMMNQLINNCEKLKYYLSYKCPS